jgi:hypothetical protein
MDRPMVNRRGQVQSMVRPTHDSGRGVLLLSLSTLVLRIWDAQPIGNAGRGWHSLQVKKTAQIAERVVEYRRGENRGTRSVTH